MSNSFNPWISVGSAVVTLAVCLLCDWYYFKAPTKGKSKWLIIVGTVLFLVGILVLGDTQGEYTTEVSRSICLGLEVSLGINLIIVFVVQCRADSGGGDDPESWQQRQRRHQQAYMQEQQQRQQQQQQNVEAALPTYGDVAGGGNGIGFAEPFRQPSSNPLFNIGGESAASFPSAMFRPPSYNTVEGGDEAPSYQEVTGEGGFVIPVTTKASESSELPGYSDAVLQTPPPAPTAPPSFGHM